MDKIFNLAISYILIMCLVFTLAMYYRLSLLFYSAVIEMASADSKAAGRK